MTTAPIWSPVDDDTHDLLQLVATGPLFGDADEQRFLIACWTDARDHDGRVSGDQSRNCGKPVRVRVWQGRAS